MHIFLIVIVAVVSFLLIFGFGVFVGSRLSRGVYHGVIHIRETPEGVIYQIELAGDPELLVFQDSITLKILPPDYEKMLSRGKLGV